MFDQDLLLRRPNKPDAMLGWHDTHGHPFCLTFEEAVKLGTKAAEHSDWKGSHIPFLLLNKFVAIVTPEEARKSIEQQAQALHELGLLTSTVGTNIPPSAVFDVQRQIGINERAVRFGDVDLRVFVQSGLEWHVGMEGDLELIAHKPWDAIGHLRDYAWPIPCNTIRTRYRFHHFPQAAAEVAAHAEDCADGDSPVFPFEAFRAMLAQI